MTQSCDNCLHSRVGPEQIQVCVHEVAKFFCSLQTWNMLQGCPVERVLEACSGPMRLYESKEVAAE